MKLCRLTLSIALACLALALASCSTPAPRDDGSLADSTPVLTHASVEEAYRAEFEAQAAGLETPQPLNEAEAGAEPALVPLHMGVAFRPSAMGGLMKREMGREVLRALDIEDGMLRVAGQEIPVHLEHELLELELTPDDACGHCLRVSGTIAGRFDVDLPLVGEGEDEPYAGEFSLVAPLEFVSSADGALAMRLDTNQIPRLGGLWVDLKLESLPERAQKPLREQLTKLFTEHLSAGFQPVTVFTVNGYDLGLHNVALMPAGLTYDVGAGTYFAGIGTNLPGIEGEVEALHALDRDAVLGVTMHLQILTHRIRLKMHRGELPLRYTTRGEPDAQGPVHVLLRGIRASEPGDDSAVAPHLEVELEVFAFDADQDDVPPQQTLLTASVALPTADSPARLLDLRSASPTTLELNAWRESPLMAEFTTLLDTLTTPREVRPPRRQVAYGLHRVELQAPGLRAFVGVVEVE